MKSGVSQTTVIIRGPDDVTITFLGMLGKPVTMVTITVVIPTVPGQLTDTHGRGETLETTSTLICSIGKTDLYFVVSGTV